VITAAPEPHTDWKDHGQTSAVARLAQVPWSVGSAVGLVAIALALSLLAGAVVAQIGGAGLPSAVRALASGGVFLALYTALLGIVWGSSATLGVRFADEVGLARTASLRWYGAALAAAVIGWLFSAGLMSALGALGAKLPREDLAVFRLLPSGPLGSAITVLLLVVVAPIAEEIVYRGVLLPSLGARWGLIGGLVVSSAVFSAVHLSVFGFVPLLVAGALFGWLFIRSESLWVAITAHAAYNALGVIALFASKSSGVL
jgi:membrane protease YdiL (CAAX protease family)